MAQRIFAPANETEDAAIPAADAPEAGRTGPRGDPHAHERARAAAYVDLWERHLMHAAVHAPAWRRPGDDGA